LFVLSLKLSRADGRFHKLRTAVCEAKRRCIFYGEIFFEEFKVLT